MAHISSASEYVLHCLLYLAGGKAGVREASVKDLAELQGVPVEYLAKLFTKLNKAGIVVATEGVKGGFSLARPADSITVLDVVDAVEGDKALFDCKEIRARCAIFGDDPPAYATDGTCTIHAVMLDAERRMREALAQHTIASLAARTLRKLPAEYGPQIVHWLDERVGSRRGGRPPAK
ncbi:RrF2 family transcriptional regulator [Pseudoduganella sp. UC29_106]|uniref:RrF2 family transcriptional regulator n=1 Tax=Pseudoduganella sp. UC29_106 TaxID=3374553 RepID=UPI003756EE18